ncbi:O-methyltransferase family 3 protein [Mycena leptocephala]|nr:O-methyltransferase family 3 protein [Mycena leptocephala]
MSAEISELWARSDQYHNSFLIKSDPILESVQTKSKEMGLRYEIAVSPAMGKFLNLLLLSIGAKRVLEVGSLGGYSAIWMARAVPDDGQVIEENVKNAGLSSKVKVIIGPAHASMQKMHPDTLFDFIFIDADKENNLNYFIEAKRLIRTGGIIIVDNVGRNGDLVDPINKNSKVEGVRKLLRYIKDDGEVEATTIHTVGEKGYDGFLYAIRN